MVDVLEGAVLLPVMAEGGQGRAVSQGMQAASRSWERRGNRFFPRDFGRNQSYRHLDFSPVRLTVNF